MAEKLEKTFPRWEGDVVAHAGSLEPALEAPTSEGAGDEGDPRTLLLELWRLGGLRAPFGQTVHSALRLAGRAFHARAIALARAEGALLVRVGAVGVIEPAPDRDSLPLSVEELRKWLAGRRVVNVERDGASIAEALLPAGVGAAALVVALESASELLGVVAIQPAPGHPFDPESIALAERMVDPLTSLLQRGPGDDRPPWARRPAAPDRAALAEVDEAIVAGDVGHDPNGEEIIGAQHGLREVMELVSCAAPADVPILIVGETGSGKEVIARAIHQRSPRAGGPIVKVNCGAIPPELIDSELFGHERGSFTGAVTARKGWFERADTGTLFLDEVGELPLGAQVRLLRVLQDGTFERVGGQRALSVNVRVVAATHRDLSGMVASGHFRRDLWYRLSVFPIHVPALRARLDDIALLAAHFAARAGERLCGAALVPNGDDIALLQSLPWPGNVRELAAIIERAALLGSGRLDLRGALALAHKAPEGPRPAAAAPPAAPDPTGSPSAPCPPPHVDGSLSVRPLRAVMIEHIERALVVSAGRIEGIGGAADLLGINPHTLRARMRKLRIDWAQFRAGGHGARRG